jgi:hypothetical protein
MKTQRQLTAAAALAAMLVLGGCSTTPSAGTTPAAPAPAAPAPAAGTPMPAMTGSGNAMSGMIHLESGHCRNAAPVAAGSMVTVMNMDTAAYTVTSDDGHSFSVKVAAGATATFKAPGEPGSYPFHGDATAGMHGVLTVR